jgi:hypothetical protein
MSTDTLTPTAPDPTLDSLQQFLDGIAKTPLLTASEEIAERAGVDPVSYHQLKQKTKWNVKI